MDIFVIISDLVGLMYFLRGLQNNQIILPPIESIDDGCVTHDLAIMSKYQIICQLEERLVGFASCLEIPTDQTLFGHSGSEMTWL